jgi:hypothetical protein
VLDIAPWQIAAVVFLILGVCVVFIINRDPTHVETTEEAVEKELRRRGE